MCKEHMGVALALKVPVFFVVTKVDICPEHVLKHTLSTLQAILKKPGVKKKPFMVRHLLSSQLGREKWQDQTLGLECEAAAYVMTAPAGKLPLKAILSGSSCSWGSCHI